METKWLTALPVYNEARHVGKVLDQVRQFSPQILVVDDGSTDGTGALLQARGDVFVETHPQNQGYGGALRTAFDYALRHGYDVLVTVDSDGQHEPGRIPEFVAACRDADIVSGSRYLKRIRGSSIPPAERRRINEIVTEDLNLRLGLELTDAFCGFKAYRVPALGKLNLTETGYAMPLELWVQAVDAGLKVVERPVRIIYLDEQRSFGGALDDADTRLEYYRLVLERSIEVAEAGDGELARRQTRSRTRKGKLLCGDDNA